MKSNAGHGIGVQWRLAHSIFLAGCLLTSGHSAAHSVALDVNGDGLVNAVDIQLVINGALGLPTDFPTDVNTDDAVNAIDVQIVINTALEGYAPDVFINEFLAWNANGLEDEDGDTSDWIELYNPGDSPVNLLGWSLTDNADTPDEWVFPDVTIEAQGYFFLFASEKDRRPVDGGEFHTNFRVDKEGEYLGLFKPENGRVATSEFTPQFREQQQYVSYGRYGPGLMYRHFDTPTPGAENQVTR